MDLQSICYCLISPTMKRFRCAVWHWRWIRVELTLEWLNCSTLSSLHKLRKKKKKKETPSCSWAVPWKWTAPFYKMHLHPYVFSKHDSWIAVVSALSVRQSLLGSSFLKTSAGSQCHLAWQITLKHFPATTLSQEYVYFCSPMLTFDKTVSGEYASWWLSLSNPLLLVWDQIQSGQWEFSARWF